MIAEPGTRYILDIEHKDDIEGLLSFDSAIPEAELHILDGSYYAELFTDFNGPISVSLRAIARFGKQGYLIGYIPSAKVAIVSEQKTPFAINHPLVDRELLEFRNNECYPAYQFQLITLPTDIDTYLKMIGDLAPWAVPNQLHPGNKELTEEQK
jgi:hypothetical protein